MLPCNWNAPVTSVGPRCVWSLGTCKAITHHLLCGTGTSKYDWRSLSENSRPAAEPSSAVLVHFLPSVRVCSSTSCRPDPPSIFHEFPRKKIVSCSLQLFFVPSSRDFVLCSFPSSTHLHCDFLQWTLP